MSERDRDVTVWQCRCCFYWERMGQQPKDDGIERGKCRINPPWLRPVGAGFVEFGMWPTTQEDDWCGKFTEDAP
jgi:hypothetical protein